MSCLSQMTWMLCADRITGTPWCNDVINGDHWTGYGAYAGCHCRLSLHHCSDGFSERPSGQLAL